MLAQQNWSYLRHGIIVWLDVPLPELHRRLQGDQHRPLLQSQNPQTPNLSLRLQTLMDQRRSLYAQADVQVPYIPNESLDQLTARVIDHIRQCLKPLDPPDCSSETSFAYWIKLFQVSIYGFVFKRYRVLCL